MGMTLDLLPLTTMAGQTGADVAQTICESIDTSKYTTGVVKGKLLGLTPTTTPPSLIIEGSDDGQAFVPILTLNSQIAGKQYLNKTEQPGSEGRLYRILRWRVHPGATTWMICGRVTVTLK